MVETLLPKTESSLKGLPEERRFARLRPSIFEAGHPPSQAPTASPPGEPPSHCFPSDPQSRTPTRFHGLANLMSPHFAPAREVRPRRIPTPVQHDAFSMVEAHFPSGSPRHGPSSLIGS